MMNALAHIRGPKGELIRVENAFSSNCWFEAITEATRRWKGEWAVRHVQTLLYSFATTNSFIQRWAEWNVARHYDLLNESQEFTNFRPIQRTIKLLLSLNRWTVEWSDDAGIKMTMPLLVPLACFEVKMGEGWGYTFQYTLADPVEGAISQWAGRRQPLPFFMGSWVPP